jgi:hypothetical protein
VRALRLQNNCPAAVAALTGACSLNGGALPRLYRRSVLVALGATAAVGLGLIAGQVPPPPPSQPPRLTVTARPQFFFAGFSVVWAALIVLVGVSAVQVRARGSEGLRAPCRPFGAARSSCARSQGDVIVFYSAWVLPTFHYEPDVRSACRLRARAHHRWLMPGHARACAQRNRVVVVNTPVLARFGVVAMLYAWGVLAGVRSACSRNVTRRSASPAQPSSSSPQAWALRWPEPRWWWQ